MKKWLLGMMAAVMAVSLAACTPTTERKRQPQFQRKIRNRQLFLLPAGLQTRFPIQM
jgi:ABC-type Zn uptake system ZnuABC Zn-binding protein ZnuA